MPSPSDHGKRDAVLAALIEKLHAAEGPDRDIDETIHFDVMGVERGHPFCDKCGSSRFVFVSQYTKSLDAALTLVPKGVTWDLCFDEYMIACVGGAFNTGRGANPAISLCIAALKTYLAISLALTPPTPAPSSTRQG